MPRFLPVGLHIGPRIGISANISTFPFEAGLLVGCPGSLFTSVPTGTASCSPTNRNLDEFPQVGLHVSLQFGIWDTRVPTGRATCNPTNRNLCEFIKSRATCKPTNWNLGYKNSY